MNASVRPPGPPAPGRRAQIARAALGVAYATYAISKLVRGDGFDPLLDGVLVNAVLLGAPLVLWGTIRRDDSARHGLRLLAAAALTWSIGNVVWTVSIRPLDPAPYPSLADGLWLAFYPLAALAIAAIAFTGRRTIASLLDALIGGCAIASVTAAFVFDRIVRSAIHGSSTAVAVNLAYPVGDLLLILLIVGAAIAKGRPTLRSALLLAGLGIFGLGDSVYLAQIADGTYQSGLIDLSWVTALVVLSFASTRPRHARDAPPPVRPARSIALPVLFAAVALAMVLLHQLSATADLSFYLALAALTASMPRLIVAGHDATRLADAERLARLDEVTGLPNRRAYFEALDSALDRHAAEPTGASLTVMILDLDGFKTINDTHGHHAGDELLRAASQAFSSALRSGDVVARFGGDEFAVVARCTGAGDAFALARRLHDSLQRVATTTQYPALTVSVGIALTATHNTNPDQLLAHADTAMYRAKRERIGTALWTEDSSELTKESTGHRSDCLKPRVASS